MQAAVLVPHKHLMHPASGWRIVLLMVLVVGSIFASGIARRGDRDDLTPSLRGSAGTWYHVYFTRPHALEQPTDPVGGLDGELVRDLNSAQHEIVIATFDLDLRTITDALQTARRRGISVRLVVDDQNLEKPLTAWMVGELQRAGIPITFDRRRAFMHNKFLVIDQRIVWTGSANLTVNDTFRNNNNMLRIISPELAGNYAAKFEALFAGQGGPGHRIALPHPSVHFGSVSVDNAFAPDAPITDEVVARIKAARRSIDLLAFTFTSKPIADAIIDARRRKVQVRGVLESYNAHAAVSSLGELKRAGVDMQMDGNCYNMHDKVMILDRSVVITGSFNWTSAAQRQNDENVLMIADPALAQDYTREFERIYAKALQPDRCG